jgi:hypothetical protein
MIEVALKDCNAKSYSGNYFLCAIASMSLSTTLFMLSLCLSPSPLQTYKKKPMPMEKSIIHCDFLGTRQEMKI